MPFLYKGDRLKANGGRVMMEETLDDSTTFTVGDGVKYDGTNGVIKLWGAGGAGAGIIAEFVKSNGSPVTDNGSGSDYTDTYTTGASNTIKAVIDVSKTSQYSVEADATLGTNTGSDKAGVNLDCIPASNKIDESSVQAAGTTASFFSYGQDPDPVAPDNSLIVSIQESQIDI